MRRLRTFATSRIPWRCGGLSLGSPGSPGLPWALLCPSGIVWALWGVWAPLRFSRLSWALLGSPGLTWALLGSWLVRAFLDAPVLFWARVGSPGLVWALLGSLGLVWALLGSPGFIRASLGSYGLFQGQCGHTQLRIYEVRHVILSSMVAQTIMHRRRHSTNV